MKSSSVSKIKATLSEYLEKVKKGEEVTITEHGRPIAKIIPFRTKGPSNAERGDLARQGILELGKGRLSPIFLVPPPIADPEGSVVKALLEEREEAS